MLKTYPQAVVFDWDNTLVDSWPVIMEAINTARVKFGLNAWSYDEILQNCTRAARVSFPEWFGDRWQEAYEFYYGVFDNLRKSRDISVKHGAKELLDFLKANNTPSYIVSNKSGPYLRHEVTRLGWDDYFVAVIGAGDTARDKPARDHVDHALQLGGHEAHADVWFIGDSEADVQCALNSGCTPIFIGTPELGARLGAALSVPDCTAIQQLLTKIKA